MMRDNKGFTLIELLVSISIIGFMASVAIAATKNIRVNSKRASLQQSSVQLRNAMNLYYDTNNSYGSNTLSCSNNVFFTSEVSRILVKINADAPANANCSVVNNGQDWAVYFAYPGGSPPSGNFFMCVDGRNKIKLNNVGDTIFSGGAYIHLGYCQ